MPVLPLVSLWPPQIQKEADSHQPRPETLSCFECHHSLRYSEGLPQPLYAHRQTRYC